MSAFTHDEMLETWSKLCAEHPEHADPSMLLMPCKDGLAVAAFQPTDDHSIGDCVDHAAFSLITGKVVDQPCAWAAVVAPAFMQHVSHAQAEGTWDRGELQRRYAEGDMEIREVVCVTSLDIGGKPTAMAYSQPLLEPIDTEAGAVDGPVADALRRAIMCSILAG